MYCSSLARRLMLPSLGRDWGRRPNVRPIRLLCLPMRALGIRHLGMQAPISGKHRGNRRESFFCLVGRHDNWREACNGVANVKPKEKLNATALQTPNQKRACEFEMRHSRRQAPAGRKTLSRGATPVTQMQNMKSLEGAKDSRQG